MNKTPKKGTLYIACEGAATVPYHNILNFQGELKELSEEDCNRLKKEILEYGFNSPIHVWINGSKIYNLDGHQRILVLMQLENEGYKIPDIPVDYITAKNIKQAKHILLSRISQYGKVSPRGIYDYLKEAQITIDSAKESFSIPGVDLDSIKAEFFVDKDKEERDETEDDVILKVKSRCKTGDLWLLGDHRLLCGDATHKEDVEKLMPNKCADITFTSPPYNAGCFGYDNGKDKYKGKKDNKSHDEYFEFLVSFVDICLEKTKFVFFNNQFLSGNRYALGKFFGYYHKMIKEIFPWIKNTAPPNVNKGVFTNRFEFILCLENNNSIKGFPVSWQGKYNNIIEGHTAAKEKITKHHSATMPLYVIEWFIERLKFIQTIFDPFGGCGSTLIACEKTNRKCFMIEIEPHYCDIIINRWEKYSGQKARKVETKLKKAVKKKSKHR